MLSTANYARSDEGKVHYTANRPMHISQCIDGCGLFSGRIKTAARCCRGSRAFEGVLADALAVERARMIGFGALAHEGRIAIAVDQSGAIEVDHAGRSRYANPPLDQDTSAFPSENG